MYIVSERLSCAVLACDHPTQYIARYESTPGNVDLSLMLLFATLNA